MSLLFFLATALADPIQALEQVRASDDPGIKKQICDLAAHWDQWPSCMGIESKADVEVHVYEKCAEASGVVARTCSGEDRERAAILFAWLAEVPDQPKPRDPEEVAREEAIDARVSEASSADDWAAVCLDLPESGLWPRCQELQFGGPRARECLRVAKKASKHCSDPVSTEADAMIQRLRPYRARRGLDAVLLPTE